MDFFKLVKSLDALVFEILSWLYFYPRTLLRVLFRPYPLMADTAKQMEEDDEPAFGDRIGPPLFLALTLGLLHLVELAIDPETAANSFGNEAVAAFMADDKNLLGFRIILYGILPLLAASRQLAKQQVPIQKSTLKTPFYAQCYAAAGFAVITNGSIFAMRLAAKDDPTILLVVVFGALAAYLWLGWVEARWFHRVLACSRLRAFGHALVLLAMWSVLAVGAMIAIG